MEYKKTAFEILQSKLTIEDTSEFRLKHIPEILDAMLEFAELHCEAQLKAILEKTNYTQRTAEMDAELEEMITDAYPLTNIK